MSSAFPDLVYPDSAAVSGDSPRYGSQQAPPQARGALGAFALGTIGLWTLSTYDVESIHQGRISATDHQSLHGRPTNSSVYTAWTPLEDSSGYRAQISAPVRSLLRVFDRWAISPEQASKILGDDDAELIKNLRSGTAVLRNRDMRDRLRLVLEIYEGVFSLFSDADTERAWLREPLPALAGQSLLNLMSAGSMEDLFVARDFVEYLNGRR